MTSYLRRILETQSESVQICTDSQGVLNRGGLQNQENFDIFDYLSHTCELFTYKIFYFLNTKLSACLFRKFRVFDVFEIFVIYLKIQ